MGVDYYNILKVGRNANEQDIKKAYKRLAMIWHPDKNPSNNKEAEAKFKRISVAYDVLIDPNKRQIYDLYGEEGLNSSAQVPPSPSPPPHPRRDTFRFNPRNHDDIYADFFSSSAAAAGSQPSSNAKAPLMEEKLPCTLEDLYLGTTKKMRILRTLPDASGKPKSMEEMLTINVKPGWKKGTKITFPEKGNQGTGATIPGDLVFVIDEKPHGVYRRDGNDLVTNQRLSLLDALTGKTLSLMKVDGSMLSIPVTDIVKPGYEMVIEGEGMPISKEPGKKGNLKIKFDVKFPSRLTAEQKSNLRRILGDS